MDKNVFNQIFSLVNENIFQVEIQYTDKFNDQSEIQGNVQIETSLQDDQLSEKIKIILQECQLNALLDWRQYVCQQSQAGTELTFRNELNKSQTFDIVDQLIWQGKKTYFCIRVTLNSLLNKDVVIITVEPVNVDKQQSICLETSMINLMLISNQKRSPQNIKISLDDLINELLEEDYKDCFVTGLNEFVRKQMLP